MESLSWFLALSCNAKERVSLGFRSRERDEPRGRSMEGTGARGPTPAARCWAVDIVLCPRITRKQGELENPFLSLAIRWKCPGPRAEAIGFLARRYEPEHF